MPPPSSHPSRGFLFIALSAILFGSLGVATQFVFASAPTNAYSVTLLRALIALPVLVLISIPLAGKKFFAIARRDLRIMIFAGLMMAMYQVSFVLALRLVNVTIATLITLCMVPVFAAFLSAPLLRERVHRNIYFAMGIAIAGVVLLIGFQPVNDFGANAWLGIALALMFLLYLGIGISVIGYAFLILGLRTTPATIATIIALLEPLTGALLAWLWLGERLGAMGVAGAALLLAAMGIVRRSQRETAEPGEV